MNSTEINNVINNLCAKFGTTSAYLIPEMARYNIIRDISMVILSLIPLVLGAIIWRIGHVRYKNWREENPDNNFIDASDYIGYWITSGALLLVFFVILTVNVYDLIGWVSSPTAAFAELILNSLRGGT